MSGPALVRSEGETTATPTNGASDGLLDHLLTPFEHEEDPDGPINTDRPTFTPSNAVVPYGRFQIESGYTYTRDTSSGTTTNLHDFPELAIRYGFSRYAELRLFWQGGTYSRTLAPGQPVQRQDGVSNLLAGFKWRLTSEQRGWVPLASLITAVSTPTGDPSQFSSKVEPSISLLYGWSLTDRLSLSGSTGYDGMNRNGDSFQQFSQSLVAFYNIQESWVGFYEWYVLPKTNSSDNRPEHYMDGGLLYRPTPNTQFDIRAGFGLGDHPNDLFTGAGFSIRF